MPRFLTLLTVLSVLMWPALATAQQKETVKPVKLLELSDRGGGITRQFFGTVVARQTVDLAFQVPGQILKLPVIEGEVTPKGEMVAQLDLVPFELTLEQARLQKGQADRAVARYEQLSGAAVSEVTVEDSRTQAGLAGVSVSNAENDLGHATLYAPFDALVAERMVENFTTISAGTPVVRLHDMSELRIEIDVPEVLFQRAGADPDVTVTARFPASDEVFPLEVREFKAQASAVGQSFQITFGMEPPENLPILPGASVTVTAEFNDDRSGLRVPASALVPGDGDSLRAMVFEQGEGDIGTVRAVEVLVEPLATGEIRVRSGLSAGDEIVVMGAKSLKDGEKVRRFTGFDG
ncbi:RND family efflux transporter MFP subunit [Litoreibacter ponti]|uniref:RND family efflux transporter MFP subunit n=1 Tax=Litoreibacter ponti TaxID=1510457 RepID=A0A2T6BMS3_9RHOB|nr:efflux RND transporter periplasmic adaptor subunit [Litoreibacter ponti]PTX57390.1 RND family efflux transporter MFP subunit [Litoreibacter ponti]